MYSSYGSFNSYTPLVDPICFFLDTRGTPAASSDQNPFEPAAEPAEEQFEENVMGPVEVGSENSTDDETSHLHAAASGDSMFVRPMPKKASHSLKTHIHTYS